ncbi:non-ribosomal peptide synthetase [Aquimarina sp. RZ0]|uniref:non-ribosomal peptide synthetase n=1 Tax=Aquimarina sp. RZ0 TaxID=2607730 RepID=UPI0011F34483|nr:non-ribosomal peptide synthetase [Aquimarina sp. RZ0]KAA1242340.1 amino acid adenylation domain-containing protein [Aquimarina sp. RZ0]
MNKEILNILKDANKKDIKLIVDKGSLSVKSNNSIDPSLLQKIKDNKDDIIRYIEKHQGGTKIATLEKIIPYNRDNAERIPLSFSQERLWFLDQLQGSLEYHMPVVLQLKGDLNVSFLEASLRTIISRHEVLRTVIYSEKGVGYQDVISPSDWVLENVKVNSGESIEEMISAFSRTPFDLSKDYMLRACLYDLGNQEYIITCIFHHIASDGWSEGLLVNEFIELYSAFIEDRAVDLPELSLQYSDYSVWQREYVEGDVLEQQLSYWEGQLKGVSPLSLPTDNKRPSIQSYEGTSILFTLDTTLSTSIHELCQKEGVTLFMVLLSTFKVLLSRYSGQEDICIGTPIANRTQSELEGIIGLFVNTLAIRSDVNSELSFKELLTQIKQTTLEGYDHQLASFEKVVNRIVSNRDLSMPPLFQVMFVLQNTPEEAEIELENLKVTPYEYEGNTALFDLTLNVDQKESGIVLKMEYCTALFNKATVQKMLIHFQELLKSIVSDHHQKISHLSMLTDEEEDELLHVFNTSYVEYPRDKTIIDVFEEQVKRFPDTIAVVFNDKKLTYKELDKRSNQLAHYLIKQGIKDEDLIGICIERSLEMIIGILGILKAGGVYVPMDPDYPSDRIHYMINDADIDLVISTVESKSVLLEEQGLEILLLDKDWDHITKEPSDRLEKVVTADHLAYVIYTSGSTGKPKGVLIKHSNVVRLFKHESGLFDFSSNDVWTLFHSFCFDFSVWEMYGALFYGGRLVIVPKAKTKDTIAFKELLIKEGVTVLNQTPSAFYVLQEALLNDYFPISLRYVIFGGEALNPSYLGRWKTQYSECKLINMYGITETTVHVTYKEITKEDVLNSISTIGAAIPTLNCYIVDEHLNLVPIGVIGELCIGGAGVAKGYLNRTELTSQKFIKNPFSRNENDRLYKSGDLGRWLPDGTIEYIGRKDTQVKIRGYRIELGEIESVLSSLEFVHQCCVLAKEDSIGNKRLVVYVVIDGDLDKKNTQKQLGKKLPEYMIPQIWVTMNEMPITSNGKIDKKNLPEPDNSQLSTQEYIAPRNEKEEQLVSIWQELLGGEKIGIHDDFFELGGDSIISIRLISKINETFNRQIQLQNLFKYSTIQLFSDSVLGNNTIKNAREILYETVESQIAILASSILQSIENSDLVEDVYPMSDIQQGMIIESLSTPDLGIFHDQMVFPLKDATFDITIFRNAINLLIEKHSIFRTYFNLSDYEEPVQIVYKNTAIDNKVIYSDLSLSNRKEQEKRIEEYLVSERKKPFEFKEKPLYRFHLFNVDSDQLIFVFQFHHSILDGWSVASFITELYKVYFELKNDAEYRPLALTSTLRDFIISEWVDKQDEEASSFWKKELFEYKYLDVFSKETETTEYYSKRYDISFLDKLREKCRNHKMSLKTVLYGAYLYALQMLTYESELTVGLVSNTRPLVNDGDKILGCFVNTLPVRYIFEEEEEESWLSYFESVNRKIEEISLYGRMTLFEIKKLAGIHKDEDVFDALFNYIDFHVYDEIFQEDYSKDRLFSGDDIKDTLDVSSFERTSTSLNLTIDLTGGTELEFEYVLHKEFKSGISLEHFHNFVHNVLHHFCNDINAPITNDIIISNPERQKLLHIFNTSYVEYPRDKTIIDVFEEQVKRFPDTIAVVFNDKKLTYKELDKRSNQLAHYLIKQGIKDEDLIGICIERSLEMIIGILGILKAGGVYVPMDPDYPSDRIHYMINDADIDLVISTVESKSVLLEEQGLEILLLDKDWDHITKEPSDRLEKVVTADHLAYVIYTSGSTGKPKGVLIKHSNVVRLFKHESGLFDFSSNDVWTLFHSFCFDFSVWEMYGALFYGGRLVIVPKAKTKDTIAFKELLIKEGVTVLNQTPSAFYVLQEALLNDYFPISLRYVIFGGEALNPSYLGRWKTQYSECKLINMYGITETTVHVTYKEITKEDVLNSISTIGAAIPTLNCYIVDEHLNLVPIGVIGELCIGGAGVAKGYLNRTELTSQKFIKNPFSRNENDRLYKSGDLGRWLPDGTIEYIGRKDTQVKIRGYRIELGEIESVLSSLAFVHQCCVLAKEDNIGNKRLVGYVVTRGDFDKVAIQEYLGASLPDYMIPNLWVDLDDMPLTTNGKIDKKRLSALDVSFIAEDYVEASSAVELSLAGIWQELLGVDRIGIYANFFDLGGHSFGYPIGLYDP